jgi:hypothetical protein
MLSSERIYTLDEPLKKKQRTRSSPTKFQGKWHTNLGILYINGSRGYYGHSLTNWMLANKFLTNITATADGNTVRGKWVWTLNDCTFGKFEFSLVPGCRSFSGTWGWNRRWKGGGLWNGNRSHSMSVVENPGMNVKPTVKDHAFKAQDSVDNAALEYVRRMTSKVGYTFTPTANSEPGGGIQTDIKGPQVEDVANDKAILTSVNDISKKPTQLVAQSTQAIPKTLQQAEVATPKPSFQVAEEQVAENSPKNTSAISAVALPMGSSEPVFEPSDVPGATTEEPELEPQQNHNVDKVVKLQIQSELPKTTDSCRSNEPTLASNLNEQKTVELTKVTEHVTLSIPQDNSHTEEKVVVTNDEDTEDMEDLPNLSLSNMIPLFSMP